jgi:hypothetical protein
MKLNKIILVVPIFNVGINATINMEFANRIVEDKDIDIVFIDNQSNDGSFETILQQVRTRCDSKIECIRNKKNLGLGGTIKKAFDIYQKNYNWILVIHGDGQGNIYDIASDLLSQINKDQHTYIMASRFLPTSNLHQYSKLRIHMNILLNKISKWLLKINISDYGCGIFAINTNLISSLNYNRYRSDFLFNPQLNISISHKFSSQVAEIPLKWVTSSVKSNVKPFKFVFSYMIELVRFKLFQRRYYAR